MKVLTTTVTSTTLVKVTCTLMECRPRLVRVVAPVAVLVMVNSIFIFNIIVAFVYTCVSVGGCLHVGTDTLCCVWWWGSVSERGFTFSGAGFVLLTVNVTIVVINFLLVAKPDSARKCFRPSVFDMHHVGITPTMYFFNFVFVVCNVIHGPGSGARIIGS